MADDRPTGWGGAPVEPPALDDVKAAAERISGTAVRTPLIALHDYDAATDIYLKPEVLQPVGSFKIRGVGNWALSLTEEQARPGIATTSAGTRHRRSATWGGCSGCRLALMYPTPFMSRSGHP